MLKVNNKDTKWRRSGVFIVNFEHVIAGWDPNLEPFDSPRETL